MVPISRELLERSKKLSGYPPHTRFDGRGLSISSGDSPHFQTLPRYTYLRSRDWSPSKQVGFPATADLERIKLSIDQIYPIQLRDMESPSLSHFSVIGAQSRLLPWRVVKTMWDGDALHVKGCSGTVTVSDVHWDNVEDGFGPMPQLNYWRLHRAYMKYIRDDAIENDHLIPGEIVDCLIDGCFTFLSQRSESTLRSDQFTIIKNSLVWIQAQPHDGVENRPQRNRNLVDGKAPGMLFKWQADGGQVYVENCVFRVDGLSFNGSPDMKFPPGIYNNVTLIWLGRGPYPAAIPRGVTMSRDREIWRKARETWRERLPASHPTRSMAVK